ncbi:MAG: hypothetical protein L6R41_002926 [Letrouitia leprolyta]|nr:MAG: hypothetical protein L6R41_002926 [Letrouitia leprolyta]
MAESKTSDDNFNALVKELEAVKNSLPKDEVLRHNLIMATRSLLTALETPGELVQRIVYASLPEFLGETKYRNPIDATATPFQKGHKTDLPSFQWLQKTPAYVSNFGLWMGACRKDLNNCFDTFPFEKEVATNIDPQTPLFVDVGGGVGFQCVALREKLPHLAGRVALQDLQQVIEIAIPAEGVETMVHNFRDEKPVKGKDSVV